MVLANQQIPGCWQRARAVLCLLTLLAGPTGVLPILLALGSVLEGSHTTHLGLNSMGYHLVLSHERGRAGFLNFLPSHQPGGPAHRHGFAARFFCLLTGNTQRLADHDGLFVVTSVGEESRHDSYYGRDLSSIALHWGAEAHAEPHSFSHRLPQSHMVALALQATGTTVLLI